MSYYLSDVIAALEAADPTHISPIGLGRPHSYRGYYEDVAFTPKRNISIAQQLAFAKSALGATFTGWKGGEYTMNEYSTCWLAEEGRATGDGLGPFLIEYITKDHP